MSYLKTISVNFFLGSHREIALILAGWWWHRSSGGWHYHSCHSMMMLPQWSNLLQKWSILTLLF